MKTSHPQLQITPGYTDQVLDVITWVLLTGLVAFSIYISVASDERSAAILLSLIGIATCIGFHFLKRYPHRFNYIVRITPENAARQYTVVLRMMRLVNVVMLLEFIAILIVMFVEATSDMHVDEGLLIIGVVIVGFLPMGYYLFKASGK